MSSPRPGDRRATNCYTTDLAFLSASVGIRERHVSRLLEIVLAPHHCARDTILHGCDAIADLEFKHDCAPCDTLAARATRCTSSVRSRAVSRLICFFPLGDSTLVYAAFNVRFLAPVLFAAARFAFASSARLSAQRFFVAAMIRFMPSSLIRRFGTSDPADDLAWDRPLMAAHLLFWASAIRRRDAADILRLSFGTSAAACPSLWWSILRSSAILESMRFFCASNPEIAAVMISWDRFCGMCEFVSQSTTESELTNVMLHPRHSPLHHIDSTSPFDEVAVHAACPAPRGIVSVVNDAVDHSCRMLRTADDQPASGQLGRL